MFSFLLLYELGLPSDFHFKYYIGLGLLSYFFFQVVYEFETAFLIEYYTGFELVLSQVKSVLQLYLRSFKCYALWGIWLIGKSSYIKDKILTSQYLTCDLCVTNVNTQMKSF